MHLKIGGLRIIGLVSRKVWGFVEVVYRVEELLVLAKTCESEGGKGCHHDLAHTLVEHCQLENGQAREKRGRALLLLVKLLHHLLIAGALKPPPIAPLEGLLQLVGVVYVAVNRRHLLHQVDHYVLHEEMAIRANKLLEFAWRTLSLTIFP